jgi:hypothetical protein
MQQGKQRERLNLTAATDALGKDQVTLRREDDGARDQKSQRLGGGKADTPRSDINRKKDKEGSPRNGDLDECVVV